MNRCVRSCRRGWGDRRMRMGGRERRREVGVVRGGRLAVEWDEPPSQVKVEAVATGLGKGEEAEASAEGIGGVLRRLSVDVLAGAPALGVKAVDFV